MNITWEMVFGFVSVLAAIGSLFAYVAKKFGNLQRSIGKVDKKKVSHKTCIERQNRCPCVIEFKHRLKKDK